MKRESGIDLLRLLSMFMVVLLHVLGHGGILSSATEQSLNYNTAWFLEIAAYGAANLFAMITGYLMINATFKLERLIGIWVQTLFYSFGISLVFFIFAPLTIGKTGLFLSLFPVMTNTYWYVTAYVGLFFLTPLLTWAIHKLSKRQAISGLILILVLFTLLPMIAGQDLFALNSGYSTFWLMIMVASGAIIRKWDLFSTKKKSFALGLYLINVAIVFLKILVIDVLYKRYIGEPVWTFTFLSYTSPFIYLSSLGLFLLVARSSFKSLAFTKILKFLSPLAFGVYLFSEHPLIWQTFIAGKFAYITDYSAPVMVLNIFLFTAVIFCISLAVEYLRSSLFKLAKIDHAIGWFSQRITAVSGRILNWIEVRI